MSTGPKAVPLKIDPKDVNYSDEKLEGVWFRKCKNIELPVGSQSPTPPIFSYGDTIRLEKLINSCLIKSKNECVNGEKLHIYFHGYIEFKSASGNQRGRCGFSFIYNFDRPELGAFVSLDPDNQERQLWYYEELSD